LCKNDLTANIFGNFAEHLKICIFQMSIEYFVLKSGRYLSLIALVVFLLLKYYQLPDPVAVYFEKNTAAAGFLPKSDVFYSIMGLILGLFALTEVLLSVLNKVLANKNSLVVWGKTWHKEGFSTFCKNWINLISVTVHSLLILAVLILAKLNSTEYAVTVADYNWYQLTLLLGLFLLILYPVVKLIFGGNKA
jgi:hypothetical protein